jgi:hypothetical protein
MTEDPGLLSREEVLAGLPTRRARTLVYLIEREAARRRAQREVGTMSLLGERSAEARELAWIEAFALGEEPPRRPTVQEIETAAAQWASLVPASAEIRAAAARLLADRYRLDHPRVTGIRRALGLDTEEVAAAFERQTGRTIDTIWSRATPLERLRWLATAPERWLEGATAFRAALAVTFFTCLGQSILIVPVAVAAVGPVAAVASILVIGLLALCAVAAVAEATTRNGEVRFRGAFFGRLATSALGAGAGTVPGVLGILGAVLQTLSAFIGLALLLAVTIPIPAAIWAAALGVIMVVLPLRLRRTTSFGGLVALGLCNLGLLAGLSVVLLGTAGLDGELTAPSLSPPGDIGVAAALGLIVGVLLTAYADPVSTVQIARVVLPRDPDGTEYVRGSVAGMAAFVAATVVFSAVLLFVVPAADLAGEDGSALDAVGDRGGAAAIALATLIGIGLFGTRLYALALALFDFVDERLPGPRGRRVVLTVGQGRVLLIDRGDQRPAISLTYQGIREGRAVIAIAGGPRQETAERALPSEASSTIRFGDDVLELRVVEADEAALRLSIATDLAISYDGDPVATGPGVAQSLLGDSDASRLSAWLIRAGGGSASEAARRLGWSEPEARKRLEELVSFGGATLEAGGRFVPRMSVRRQRTGLDADVWSRLGLDPPAEPVERPEGRSAGIIARVLASPAGRMIVASVPTASLAALAAALIVAGTASVSDPFRIAGVIVFATISGLLPPMLLLAARRRSDLASGGGGGILVGRALMALTALSAPVILILHATILWTDPVERGLAAAAAVFAFASVVLAIRHGSFRPASLVELRQSDEDGPVRIIAEECDRPLQVQITLGGRELAGVPEIALEQASEGLVVRSHTDAAEELRVTAHRLEASGTATALPVTAELEGGDPSGVPGAQEPGPVRLEDQGGSASFPTAADWTLVIRSEERARQDSTL